MFCWLFARRKEGFVRVWGCGCCSNGGRITCLSYGRPFHLFQRVLTDGQSKDVFDQLVAHGCIDMTSTIDPNGYSASPIYATGFGEVWKAHLVDGTEVAVKTWRFSCVSHDSNQLKVSHNDYLVSMLTRVCSVRWKRCSSGPRSSTRMCKSCWAWSCFRGNWAWCLLGWDVICTSTWRSTQR